MSNEYKNNHYVPRWYQKRFLLPEQLGNELYYLDFNPPTYQDSKGKIGSIKSVRKLGFSVCFAKEHLYQTNIFGIDPKSIEKYFFGKIDGSGQKAVEYFNDFAHPSVDQTAFRNLLIFMGTQKLRTPKGLAWLSNQTKTKNKDELLKKMLAYRGLFGAVWTEAVWQIADADSSTTKFIISDHPITVYNRVCGPKSQHCREFNDPDIRLNGSHTIFPLSYNKILILTNLSWVRNPYQSELSMRPNPNPWRSAIFNFTDIQTLRHLSEQEVIDINYIIKRRAHKYIAAAKEDWLYPERHITTTKWNKYGYGYLLMPDPRSVHLGGEIVIGHHGGGASWYDEYGRRPWQKDYGKESSSLNETDTLYRFKGEFARLFGSKRRGRTFEALSIEKERDGEEFHQYHLGLEQKHKKRKRKNLKRSNIA